MNAKSVKISHFSDLPDTGQVYIIELTNYTILLSELLKKADVTVAAFIQITQNNSGLTSSKIPIISLMDFAALCTQDRQTVLFSENLVRNAPQCLQQLNATDIDVFYDTWPIMKPYKEAREWFYIAGALRFYSNKEYGVLYDIGSNRGGATSIALDHYRHIIGIEANPVQQQVYLGKFAEYAHVQLLGKALGSKAQKGPRKFYVDASESGGGSSLYAENTERHKVTGIEEINVVVETLDEVCDEINLFPTFIKIDIEGSEPDALLAGKRMIEKHKPVILFECWNDSWDKGVRELCLYLKEQGYALYSTIAGGDLWDIFEYGYSLDYVTNALCLPATKKLPTKIWGRTPS